jgi:glycosyltransferase involved in cell wall biosynthesis
MKKRVLLLYPYYWPNYKSGGPVQSLFNMVSLFSRDADFYLISRDRDLDGTPNKNVQINKWNKGPNGENIYFVREIGFPTMLSVFKFVKPDNVLINGLFDVRTTLFGLWCALLFNCKVIVSPRGMLQEWGLKRNRLKKKLYLVFIKLFLVRATWHATDSAEVRDIVRAFGAKRKIFVASNIPRGTSAATTPPFPDEHGKINLVFISLINENKNLHLVIEAINRHSSEFTFDIYGPVIDTIYWQRCLALMEGCTTIRYHGAIPPWEVPQILASYHYFVLPTMGENFGHAIFDSLASGTPVIISRTTPWMNIDTSGAGYYVDLSAPSPLDGVLRELKTLQPSAYANARKNSLTYAKKFWESQNFLNDYKFLLGCFLIFCRISDVTSHLLTC